MTLPIISAEQARTYLAQGGVLVDVREADEHARERVPGVRHMPLSRLEEAELNVEAGKPVLFHCKSGMRTQGAAGKLAEKVGPECEAFIVEGGIDALKKAGVATSVDASQPLELQRQVQIGAGSLALVGTLLGLLFSPWFFAIPAFVGAGLMFAGLTGFCGMARILVRAPWNAPLRADSQQR